METKRIIPAGTPGIFRPEWGEFPEPNTLVDAWVVQDGTTYRYINEPSDDVGSMELEWPVFAWQYAPVAPPVDGLEAFKQEWSGDGADPIGGHGYRYYPADGLLIDGYNINPHVRKIGTFPTLAAAQEAAYQHFLSTRNA